MHAASPILSGHRRQNARFAGQRAIPSAMNPSTGGTTIMSENFVHCRRGLAGVSLHDCHVTRIDRRGDLVELTLPRGV